MKKIKVLVLFVIGVIVGVSFIVKAYASNVYPNDYYENYRDYVLNYNDGIEFNYILYKGDEYYYEVDERIYDCMSGEDCEGIYDYVTCLDVTTSSGRRIIGELHTKFKFENSYVLSVDYYLNDYLYYHRNISDSGDYPEFTYFDLCDYYGEYVTAKINGYYDDWDDFYCDSSYISYYMNHYYQFLDMGYCLYYVDNTNEEISIDFENPLDIEDIMDRVGIRNKNGVKIGDYELVWTDYDIDNVEVGVYNAKMRGIDNDNSVYFKNIHIVSKRVSNPIHLNNLRARYNETLTRNDIINSINIDCEYSELVCKSDYFGNENKCGDYEYSISIVTSDNDNFMKTGSINVYDDIAPIVSVPKSVDTDTENRLTYDVLLERCLVYDEYSDEGLVIKIDELNSEDSLYINNYNLSGRYKFRVTGIDQYNNSTSDDFILYVSKKVNTNVNNTTTSSVVTTQESTVIPSTSSVTSTISATNENTNSSTVSSTPSVDKTTITASSSINVSTSTVVKQKEEFKFRTTTTNILSIEDMKRMLLDSDEISKGEYDNVSIRSDYFDNANKAGVYDVYINDGNHEYVIEMEVSEIKKEEVKEEEVENKKITTRDIIMYSSIGGLFLVIVILIILLRRKKK